MQQLIIFVTEKDTYVLLQGYFSILVPITVPTFTLV